MDFISMDILILIAIFVPFLLAGIHHFIKNRVIGNISFIIFIGFIVINTLLIGATAFANSAGQAYLVETSNIPFNIGLVFKLLNLSVSVILMLMTIRAKNWFATILSAITMIILVSIEIFRYTKEPLYQFKIDTLAFGFYIMILVIGILITLSALSYIRKLRKTSNWDVAKSREIFTGYLLSTGAFAGLFFTNNLMWVFLFVQILSIYSRVLTGYKVNTENKRDFERNFTYDILLNLALLLFVIIVYINSNILAIDELAKMTAFTDMLPFAASLLLFSILGKAMVIPLKWQTNSIYSSPSPISALIITGSIFGTSSYLLMRIATAFVNLPVAKLVNVFGVIAFIIYIIKSFNQQKLKASVINYSIALFGLFLSSIFMKDTKAYTIIMLANLIIPFMIAALFICINAIYVKGSGLKDINGLIYKMPIIGICTVITLSTLCFVPCITLIFPLLAASMMDSYILQALIIAGLLVNLICLTGWIIKIIATETSVARDFHMSPEKLPLELRIILPLSITISLLLNLMVGKIYNTLITPYLNEVLPESALAVLSELEINLGYKLLNNSGAVRFGFQSLWLWGILAICLAVSIFYYYMNKEKKTKVPFTGGETPTVDMVPIMRHRLLPAIPKRFEIYAEILIYLMILIMFGVTM